MLVDSLEWLGHSGFRVRTREGVIYIDPYRVANGPKADLILITHG
ncbi:MAG: Beta-lactamase superfamily domain, partial [Thermoleophilaceae bacterium]|nr:Beta-lactamase superfamily domain [Thermoleophilaceae bacterium]